MNVTKMGVVALACVGFAAAAQANEVLLSVNQPTDISYRVAHANKDGQPVLGELQTMRISNSSNVEIALGDYDLTGLVIVSANGRELPGWVNQFNKPRQCSMTTNKAKSSGGLAFEMSEHAIKCRTSGGVFG